MYPASCEALQTRCLGSRAYCPVLERGHPCPQRRATPAFEPPLKLRRGTSVLQLNDLCLAGSIDSDDIKIVELSFRDGRERWAAKRGYDLRCGVVMTRDKDRLS
jgi:hypothetical protein